MFLKLMDFGNTDSVLIAFESRSQKDIDDILGHLDARGTSANCENVGVIMLDNNDTAYCVSAIVRRLCRVYGYPLTLRVIMAP